MIHPHVLIGALQIALDKTQFQHEHDRDVDR